LDDDYAPSQFPSPGANGVAALQVTAAHEFFHAVQFAYDYSEDSWFMEGTATWMEDEVYTAVNDNRLYLSRSPLTHPSVPADRGSGYYEYGAWITWRYFTERFDPALIRETWAYADGSKFGIDQYSLQALAHAMADRGASFADVFARFGVWNALPATFYSEGNAYRAAPASASFAVTRRNDGIGWHRLTLDHLTDPQVRFTPSTRVKSTAQLRVRVNAPLAPTAPAATVLVRNAGGATHIYPVTLDAAGSGHRVVPFGRGTVARVFLILTNASRRTSCWVGSWYSCSGHPADDNETFRYQARLVQ
jgi:hypothetical protein